MEEELANAFVVKVDARGKHHDVRVNARHVGEAVDLALTMVLSDARIHGMDLRPEEVEVMQVNEQTDD